jgi:hypothetical protein
MKKKLYLICLITGLVCVSIVSSAQAITYGSCLIIATGRSSGLSFDDTPWDPFLRPRHIGFFSNIGFSHCSQMTVIVIDKGRVHHYSDVSAVELSQAIGAFVWRVFPDYFFNLPPRVSIKAAAIYASIG